MHARIHSREETRLEAVDMDMDRIHQVMYSTRGWGGVGWGYGPGVNRLEARGVTTEQEGRWGKYEERG